MVSLWIFTSRFPYPIEKGDKLRLYYQLKELSKDYDVTLFTLSEGTPTEEQLSELSKYCSSIVWEKVNWYGQVVRTFLSFAHQLPLQVGYFQNRRLQRKIDQLYLENPPDLIYCHLIRMSEYVRHLPSPKVIDYMDAFSLGMFRASNNSKNPLWKLVYWMEAQLCAFYERWIFPYFDGWTIISSQDQKSLHLYRNDKVEIVQNGIDTDQFYFEKSLPHHQQIVFIGNLGYAPNVRAVQYLVKEVMPKLWKQYPNARLMLAGARPSKWMRRLRDPRIQLKGWVENIRDAYSEGSVFVAPLFTGSGMQNKILEAMSVGLPCVTTSIVNNSILAKEGEEILVAEDSEGFVERISFLFEDEKSFRQLSMAGRNFVEKNYHWKQATRPLIELLNKCRNLPEKY